MDGRGAGGPARRHPRRLVHGSAHHRLHPAEGEWLAQVRSGEFVYHSVREEGTTVDVHDGFAAVVSRAVHDVTLYGHRGRYRLRSTLHYASTPGGWRAVRGSSTTY